MTTAPQKSDSPLSPPGVQPDVVNLFGISINNMTMAAAVTEIIRRCDGAKPCQVCFVNADCVNIAAKDEEYLRILKDSDLTFADGIGMKIAGKLLGQEIRANVNGTDLFPVLCEALAEAGKGVFLLGARPGVPEGVRQWLNDHCPRLKVKGCQHGYFPREEQDAVIQRMADSGAEVLFVAFGVPAQEKWIRAHLAETRARVALGVGGLFDFYSGRIPRAPAWMRKMGMEWLYRFYREPGRLWKRYFVGNFVFMFRAFRERVKRPPAS
jgi:N-acetylglucosaminyldiphosphoundecaprenol N-acetyl-beta-D-mannosaminyltransferase